MHVLYSPNVCFVLYCLAKTLYNSLSFFRINKKNICQLKRNCFFLFSDRKRSNVCRTIIGTSELFGSHQKWRRPVCDSTQRSRRFNDLRPNRPQQETPNTDEDGLLISASFSSNFALPDNNQQTVSISERDRHGANTADGLPTGELCLKRKERIYHKFKRVMTCT